MIEVDVAVAVVLRQNGQMTQVLVSLRHQNAHQGGRWEFPGGKVESNESIESALARELKEELALVVTAYEPLMTIEYVYPDKAVCLHVHLVLSFDGEPQSMEGQAFKWVAVTELPELVFPEANAPIVAALMERFD
ncbi:MAG: 8-oxo-dGTP diphosphatase MutT [Pseudomonadota bacterium]